MTRTHTHTSRSVNDFAKDVRLPLTWDDEDFVLLCQAVEESIQAAMAANA